MELQIGDVVYLKSDVNVMVLMTINDNSVNGKDYWECVWFDRGEIKMFNFHKKALSKYN